MTTLEEYLSAPELARTWAARIAATHRDLTVPSTDWAIVAACRIYADVRDGLAALDTLAAMRERHHPVGKWAEDSDVVRCACGRGSCVDEEMLR